MSSGNNQFDASEMTTKGLLKGYADILDELRSRKVTRSSNNPVADLAEYLFCKSYGWTRMPPSEVLKTAKAGLHKALDETKVLQRPGHACYGEFKLWLEYTDNFIPMLEAMERSQGLSHEQED